MFVVIAREINQHYLTGRDETVGHEAFSERHCHLAAADEPDSLGNWRHAPPGHHVNVSGHYSSCSCCL